MTWIFLGISHVYADEPEFIPWAEEEKLTWDDFLGIPYEYPQTYERPDPGDIAFTWGYPKLASYDFKKVNSALCQFQITSVDSVGLFDMNQSWTTEEAKKDSDVLNHEQGHFDIFEISARKTESNMLFKIFECPAGFYDEPLIHNDIRKKVSDIGNRHQEIHDEYDLETDKGRDETNQRFWDSKIRIELKQYQLDKTDFSSDSIPKYVHETNGMQIQCTHGWKTMEKSSNGKLACITPAVASELVKRGWGKILGGFEHID